jgi:hypothetical protein
MPENPDDDRACYMTDNRVSTDNTDNAGPGGLQKEISVQLLNEAALACRGIKDNDLQSIRNTIRASAIVGAVGAAGSTVATVSTAAGGSDTLTGISAGAGAAAGAAATIMSATTVGKLSDILDQIRKCQEAVKKL